MKVFNPIVLVLFLTGIAFEIHANQFREKGIFPETSFKKTLTYHIEVKINGIKDKALYLAHYYADKQYLADTAYLNTDNSYVFEDSDTLLGGIYIIAGENKNKYFEFIYNNETDMRFESDTSDIVVNMKVKGSKENDVFFNYMRFLADNQKKISPILQELKKTGDEKEKKKLQTEITAINSDVQEFQEKIIAESEGMFIQKFLKANMQVQVPDVAAGTSKEDEKRIKYYYFKNHYWDNIDLLDDRLLRTPVLYGKIEEYFTKVVVQSPDTLIAEADKMIKRVESNKDMFKYFVWYLTNMSETSNIMGFDKIFVHMAKTYYMTNRAYWISDEILKKITKKAQTLEKLLIGVKAPDMAMVDTSYKLVTIHTVKADYLVFLFYDPDCGHCKKEIAKLKTFYKEYKSQGVEVLALFTEADVDYWKNYVKKNELQWINTINGYNIDYHDLYDIISTPTIYLMDKEKRILAKRLNADQTIDFIKNQMKHNAGK